jgi:UPF0755 protein
MKRTLLLSAGILFLATMSVCLGFAMFIARPADKDAAKQVVVIREGTSLKEVARQLEQKRIITSRRLFSLWAKATGRTRIIKAGEYRLGAHMTPEEVLQTLIKGDVIIYAVTIPEGFTNRQISELLENLGLVPGDEFLRLARDPDILRQYGISGRDAEGYLFPETYQFSKGIPARSMLETMLRRFNKALEPYGPGIKSAGMPLDNIVTLASVVEKETGRPEERPLVASVFLNRLARGMRLASDPTVIYGIHGFDGNLTRKDLETPTPYNTYLIEGLPPGPIANPGLESIKAVLCPAQTEFLYFVSKNDGSHHFSKTLSEHSRAVEHYQKKKR